MGTANKQCPPSSLFQLFEINEITDTPLQVYRKRLIRNPSVSSPLDESRVGLEVDWDIEDYKLIYVPNSSSFFYPLFLLLDDVCV